MAKLMSTLLRVLDWVKNNINTFWSVLNRRNCRVFEQSRYLSLLSYPLVKMVSFKFLLSFGLLGSVCAGVFPPRPAKTGCGEIDIIYT
jgi:hypothetical protein